MLQVWPSHVTGTCVSMREGLRKGVVYEGNQYLKMVYFHFHTSCSFCLWLHSFNHPRLWHPQNQSSKSKYPQQQHHQQRLDAGEQNSEPSSTSKNTREQNQFAQDGLPMDVYSLKGVREREREIERESERVWERERERSADGWFRIFLYIWKRCIFWQTLNAPDLVWVSHPEVLSPSAPSSFISSPLEDMATECIMSFIKKSRQAEVGR